MDTIIIAVKPAQQDIGLFVTGYLKKLDEKVNFELLIYDNTRENRDGDTLLRGGEVRFVLEELENEPGYFPVDRSFLLTTLPGGYIQRSRGDRDGEELSSPLGRGKYGLKFLRNDTELIRWMSPHFGNVAFVGAGAGNKELLTIKGRKKVEKADVVISDFLLDQGILKSYCGKDSLIIPLTRYGDRTRKNLVTQEEINETILRYALLDRSVVRLKGGDSFVFGRGGEECEYLLPFNIDYEVVPGISALLSALAYSGIPLTHRDYNRGFLVVAGYRRDCEGSDDCLLRIADNINYGLRNELVIVLYMALRNWENFSERIERKDAPVALIESGAYPGQRVFSTVVGNVRKVIDSEKLKSPTLIVIGENVKVREHLNWWESQALHGMRILSFSSELLSAELEEMVGALGGFIRSMELYELVPSELEAVSGYLRELKSYDYLVITSRNAFEIFMRDLRLLEIDVRDIPKVIVTGEKTSQEFKALGIYPDIVPRVFSADGIIESLSEREISGKRFLFPKSSLSKGNLSEYILSQGGVIEDFVLYNNVPKDIDETERKEMLAFGANYIIFTSSSSVDYYFESIHDGNMSFTAISIGSKTTESLMKQGVKNILQPDTFTIEGIRDLLLREKHRLSPDSL